MKNLIIILAAIFMFSSCEDVIDVELKEMDQDLYIVEAKITTLNSPWVNISMSLPVTVDEDYEGVSNAIVSISNDAQPIETIVLEENIDRKGYYTVPIGIEYLGEIGRTYTVNILTPDGVNITATEVLYHVEPIDSIQVKPSQRGEGQFLGIFTCGEEPAGLGDFYKWDIFINGELLNDAWDLVVTSDEFVDGNYIQNFEIFTDFYSDLDGSERRINFMDTVCVHQTSISEFAYYFYFQLFNQAGSGSLYSVPPANIEGNFSSDDGNLVLGLFTAQDVSISNSVIIDESIESQLN